jgi:hypothetical protein
MFKMETLAMINPFNPVYQNILLPLVTSQIEPYVTLYNKSIRPLYHPITRSCQNYEQAVERWTAFIKTLELAVQFSVYFFLYQKGWSFGTYHLGPPGGAIAFSLIYAAGCWVDGQFKTNMNDICTGTWLYYRGIKNFGTNREAMLISIIIARQLTHQHQDSYTSSSWEIKRHSAATWIATCFYDKPQSLPNRFDRHRDDAIDGNQDLTNG